MVWRVRREGRRDFGYAASGVFRSAHFVKFYLSVFVQNLHGLSSTVHQRKESVLEMEGNCKAKVTGILHMGWHELKVK